MYFGLNLSAADLFYVRAGYVGGELDQTNGASVGVGFKFDRFDLNLAMSDLTYSYGDNFDLGGYWEGGVGTRIPNSFNFKQGTLIVDAWDAERKELVWRGIATATLSRDPDKNDKKIEKALKKIMKKWDEAKGYRVRAIRQMKAEQESPEN